MPEPGYIPFPKENIEIIQRNATELSGVLGFLLQLKYTDTLTITINGATSKVIYNPDDTEPYDNVYMSLSNQYVNKMRYLAREIYDLAHEKRLEAKKIIE
jgi:hypothetical protein